MFGRRITLFRLMGFAVRADASWLLVILLVTWSLATGYFPAIYKGLTPRTYWLMALVGALVLFLSIIVHELSHSIVARRYGIPMKGITLFVFGGVAEMDDEPPSPKAELLMAIAGPAASVLIGGAFVGLAEIAPRMGLRGEVVAVLRYVGMTNLILAIFNLLPAFPLDGGRVLRAIIWWKTHSIRRATRVASHSGTAFGWLLVILGVLALFRGNVVGGIWWFLIGTFVRQAASMSYHQIILREMLSGQPVRRFMNPTPVAVPRTISVAELVDDYIYRYHHSLFPVVDGERLIGCVTTQQVKQLPREEWSRQTVGAIATECSTGNSISPDADAMRALVQMGNRKASHLMVVDGERLVGILGARDLLRLLAEKMELEQGPDG